MDLKERMAAIDARIAARSAAAGNKPSPSGPVSATPPAPAAPPAAKRFSPADGLADVAGVERLRGFSLKKLFAEAFRRHADADVENCFSGGFASTTPSPASLSGEWPTPWVFARCLVLSLLAYAGLDFGFAHFGNPKFLPGMIAVGSFAVPVATLLFFFEMNVWRNVSLYQVVKMLFLGGVLSLVFAMFGFRSGPGGWLGSSLGASSAGVIEELAKLAALACLADSARFGRSLNGLLLGAAVGAGFAAFESAGYAFEALLGGGGMALGVCRGVLFDRGVLSPFGHVAWTAIAGAAFWRAKRGSTSGFSAFFSWKFLRLFAVPVLLHMLWNSPWNPPFKLKFLLVGFVDWVVVFALVQEGMSESRRASRAARGA